MGTHVYCFRKLLRTKQMQSVVLDGFFGWSRSGQSIRWWFLVSIEVVDKWSNLSWIWSRGWCVWSRGGFSVAWRRLFNWARCVRVHVFFLNDCQCFWIVVLYIVWHKFPIKCNYTLRMRRLTFAPIFSRSLFALCQSAKVVQALFIQTCLIEYQQKT